MNRECIETFAESFPEVFEDIARKKQNRKSIASCMFCGNILYLVLESGLYCCNACEMFYSFEFLENVGLVDWV